MLSHPGLRKRARMRSTPTLLRTDHGQTHPR
ncbi:hypothetical protein PHLH8_32260 [Pseudomonas sp. Pc102]|nr:hypothetical protein PHLH8_32260 [Pseudomonas sp. Pc102]